MGGQETGSVAAACRAALEAAWNDEFGFTVPNIHKYNWQWLWDSCFHAITWSGLGSDRCRREMRSLFALQLPGGFLPHMGYQTQPSASLPKYGVRGHSTLTQPPMYGHALRVMHERGFGVGDLLLPATNAILSLYEQRLHPGSGLLRIVHPWESGWDDSNRWDGWIPFGWHRRLFIWLKKQMVRSLQVADEAAYGNPRFEVCSAGFNALAAFNAMELYALTGDERLRQMAGDLRAALERQWDAQAATWRDLPLRGPRTSPRGAGVKTLDSLLGVLITEDQAKIDAVYGALNDERQFARPFGLAGTAASEPSYDPDCYWRGDSWPQMTYLFMMDARRRGRPEAQRFARYLMHGAADGTFPESWNPETGAGLGAHPQSWTALAHEGELALRLQGPDSRGLCD